MLGDYSSRQWGVREITLRDGVALSTLALLPTRQAGKVVVFIAQGDLGVDARGEEVSECMHVHTAAYTCRVRA